RHEAPLHRAKAPVLMKTCQPSGEISRPGCGQIFRRPLPPHPNPLPQGEGETLAALEDFERLGFGEARPIMLPLPEGEGWGEGEGSVKTSGCSKNETRIAPHPSSVAVLRRMDAPRRVREADGPNTKLQVPSSRETSSTKLHSG